MVSYYPQTIYFEMKVDGARNLTDIDISYDKRDRDAIYIAVACENKLKKQQMMVYQMFLKEKKVNTVLTKTLDHFVFKLRFACEYNCQDIVLLGYKSAWLL